MTATYGATLQNLFTGELSIHTVYGDAPNLSPVFISEKTDRFAMTAEANKSANDPFGTPYVFGAFISVDDGNDHIHSMHISCDGDLFGQATAVADVCTYFYLNGYEDAPAIALAAYVTSGAAPLACLSEYKKIRFEVLTEQPKNALSVFERQGRFFLDIACKISAKMYF